MGYCECVAIAIGVSGVVGEKPGRGCQPRRPLVHTIGLRNYKALGAGVQGQRRPMNAVFGAP